ncbi:MAG TPA: hypothetical protein DDW50_22280, partial [Firmicutes bacterium]|nr:hypothetical protein [Bacillota bacterium]
MKNGKGYLMFDWLLKKLKVFASGNAKPSSQSAPENGLSRDLGQNLLGISNALGQSPDLTTRRFTIELDQGWAAALVYIDGLADTTIINDHILRPLMVDTAKPD